MKKSFCDICGEPAMEDMVFKSAMKVGEPWTESYPVQGTNRQCVVVAQVHFNFQDHRCGFGGPPDLCAKCAKELVGMIYDAIPYQPSPSEIFKSALQGRSP